MISHTIQPVHHTVIVSASPEDAFRLFTERIGEWWPKEHSIGQSPKADQVMELRAGGSWSEIGEDGSRCHLGRVLSWEPPHRVVMSWEITARWTPMAHPDPARASEYEVTFVDLGDGRTKVDVVHRHFEQHGDDGGANIRGAVDGPRGWPHVLDAFGQFVGSFHRTT